MKTKFKIGTRVDVVSGEDDDCNDFTGVVIGLGNGFFQVRDMDDEVWEVDESDIQVAESN